MIFNVSNASGKTKIETVPSVASSLTYNGSEQSPTWLAYDPEQLTMSGVTSAVDAGTYTVAFTPTTRYKWSDGTTAAKTVNWTINKKSISTVPSQSGTLTYSGSSQTPSWSNYNSSQLTLGGTTSGTNAKSYNATFTPKSNYKWSDGTTTAKTVAWSIAKAAGSLSLSASSGTINGNGVTKTFTVTRSGDGNISVSSSNTAVATVSLSGTTVTITSKKKGSATITVSVAAGTNHKAPSNKTYALTVDYLYLYNAGNENTAVTGGWTAVGKGWENVSGYTSAGTPVFTKNSTNMVLDREGAPSPCLFYIKNKIDLTNYTTLKYEGTLSGEGSDDWYKMAVWTSFGTYISDNIAAWVSLKGSGTSKSLNVSTLKGNHNIGFGIYTKPALTVTKVWLE